MRALLGVTITATGASRSDVTRKNDRVSRSEQSLDHCDVYVFECCVISARAPRKLSTSYTRRNKSATQQTRGLYIGFRCVARDTRVYMWKLESFVKYFI